MMATATIPENAQLSEEAEYRNTIYRQAAHRLQHLAWRALVVLGKKNCEFAIFCIQVDSRWRALVDHVMPGQDWDVIRATGADPMAQGIISWAVCTFVAKEFPDIASIALEVPPPGKMKVVVLTDGGCTIYEIEPKPEDSSSN